MHHGKTVPDTTAIFPLDAPLPLCEPTVNTETASLAKQDFHSLRPHILKVSVYKLGNRVPKVFTHLLNISELFLNQYFVFFSSKPKKQTTLRSA